MGIHNGKNIRGNKGYCMYHKLGTHIIFHCFVTTWFTLLARWCYDTCVIFMSTWHNCSGHFYFPCNINKELAQALPFNIKLYFMASNCAICDKPMKSLNWLVSCWVGEKAMYISLHEFAKMLSFCEGILAFQLVRCCFYWKLSCLLLLFTGLLCSDC